MKLKSSAILSINHSFEILARVYNGESWEDALNNTIPDRKRAEVTQPKPKIKVTFSGKGRFTFHEDESELRESEDDEEDEDDGEEGFDPNEEFARALPQANAQPEAMQTEVVQPETVQ